MTTLTLDNLLDAVRRVEAIMADDRPRITGRVFISRYLPREHYLDHVYPYHPAVQIVISLLRRWFGWRLKAWISFPQYRETSFVVNGDLFVSPAGYQALKAKDAST